MDVVVVSHIQRTGCLPEEATLHDAQSRSWSAEQGKESKNIKPGSAPPPPPLRCSIGGGKKHVARTPKGTKIAGGQKGHHVTYLHACLGAAQVSVHLAPYKTPSTSKQGKFNWLCRFAGSTFSAYDHNFSSLVASLFSWRSLAASTSSFLHATINLRPLSVTVLTHTSASNVSRAGLRNMQ